MPITPTYPGIYVEERPSGVHTIPGVSTADTAFVDFFKRGPVDRAVQMTSFSMFERIFGGLDERSEASFAIMQFFLNGGAVAWVCRAVKEAKSTKGFMLSRLSSPPQGGLMIEAANPGSWGNLLQVAVDYKTPANEANVNSFNLAVCELDATRTKVVASEVYRNLDLTPTSPNYCLDVINHASSLIRIPIDDRGQDADPPMAIPEKTCDDIMTHLHMAQKIDASGGRREPKPVTDYLDLYPITSSSVKPIRTGGSAIADAPVEGPHAAPPTPIIGQEMGDDGTLPKHPDTQPMDAGWLSLGNGPLVQGWRLLDHIAPFVFNILCLPVLGQFTGRHAAAASTLYAAAADFCQQHHAFLIVDPPITLTQTQDMIQWRNDPASGAPLSQFTNTAVYFPSFTVPNPLNQNQPRKVSPSGTVAGIYARTDAAIGVWKAPAGIDAGLLGGVVLEHKVTDAEDGLLNPLGINALRTFPVIGDVVWGTRTLQGADILESQWKYIPVRRLAYFIEQSLIEGLKWAVFEPNAEPLWSSIRLEVGTFMAGLAHEGAFENYTVTCDATTTTSADQADGVVVVVVAFEPIYPAELVVIQIKQLAGSPPA